MFRELVDVATAAAVDVAPSIRERQGLCICSSSAERTFIVIPVLVVRDAGHMAEDLVCTCCVLQ